MILGRHEPKQPTAAAAIRADGPLFDICPPEPARSHSIYRYLNVGTYARLLLLLLLIAGRLDEVGETSDF